MARRRITLPKLPLRPSRRGVAGSAWDKYVGSTGQGIEHGERSRQKGTGYSGFGTPGTGRQIRRLPVDEQKRIVGEYRIRDLGTPGDPRDRGLARSRTRRGMEAVSEGDFTILFTQNLRRQSSNPNRPRAEAAGYDSRSGTLRIRFRIGADRKNPNGAIYEYYGVPRSVWKNLQRSKSPGRFIDRVLDAYPYTQVSQTWEPQNFFTIGNRE